MLSFKIKFLIKFELSSAISLKNENIDYVFFVYRRPTSNNDRSFHTENSRHKTVF